MAGPARQANEALLINRVNYRSEARDGNRWIPFLGCSNFGDLLGI